MNKNTDSIWLEVRGLQKKWPMKTIEIDFMLDKGESLAILGRSGCGKSSVLRMIAGLLTPDSGEIFLDNINLVPLHPSLRQVGMVFQDHALFTHLRVDDNIGYGLVSKGMSRKESRLAAADWLTLFGLSGFGRRRIDSLSGGEKQRVALARTLAPGPRLVLFDEPLSALDADLRKRLQVELKKYQKELGYTAIYVTHDEEEASFLSNRILRME
ncbi:MAG TPA: ABC transporter ATP-binding protein [Treponemataceae bacterium]|nr:ABC transporter ATP-binding protein [Treponemataceae bacterium]